MKNLLLILIGILLYSCGPCEKEVEKQVYTHTVTHLYSIELISGATFTKNICTRMNDGGEDYFDLYRETIFNYWGEPIATGVKSFKRILIPDSNNIQLKIHMLSIDGVVVDLPEEWMEISKDKNIKESLRGYISGDTLYIEFNH